MKWNQRNYVAVAWEKIPKTLHFYVKQIDKPLLEEVVHINDTMGSFPNISDKVIEDLTYGNCL